MEPVIVTKRIKRMMEIAYETSFLSKEKKRFNLGTVIAKGGRVLSLGVNSFKRSPRDPKVSGRALSTQTCAETMAVLRAVKNHRENVLQGSTAYVTRRRADGSSAMAKPCIFCQKLLAEAGVKGVFYTDREGEVSYLRL